jgi:cytochrome c peroxidase
METIEPELTIPSVYSLEKKYKNETVAQRQERGHRYTEKFKKYWEVYEQSVSDITHSLSLYNRELYRYIEFLSREEDEQYLSSLEEVIHSQ